MSDRTPTVVLQYLTLPHYRRTLFQRLFAREEINFSILCGKRSPYFGLKNFEPDDGMRVSILRNHIFSIGQIRLVWQWGMLGKLLKCRPDVLVLLGVDPHNLSNFPAFFLAKLLHLKVFWWGHATLGKQGPLGRRLRLFFYRAADGALVYDNAGKQRLVGAGVESSRVAVMGNCLNEEDYPETGELQTFVQESARPHLLFSGRLTYRKRLDVLLRAMAILIERGEDPRLDVIGDGPYLSKLEDLAKRLSLGGRVKFHGACYGKDATRFFSRASFTVIPAGTGLAAIHSMAHSVPVITSNRADSHGPEVAAIIPGRTGAFFTEGDPEDLALVVLRSMPDRNRMRDECYRIVQERYTPEKVADAFVEGILRAIDGASDRRKPCSA